MTSKKSKREKRIPDILLKGVIVSFDSNQYEHDPQNKKVIKWLQSLSRPQLLELEELDKENWFGDLLWGEIAERSWPTDRDLENNCLGKIIRNYSNEPDQTLEARIEKMEQELSDIKNLTSLVEKLSEIIATRVPTVEVPFGEWIKRWQTQRRS